MVKAGLKGELDGVVSKTRIRTLSSSGLAETAVLATAVVEEER